MKIVVTGALGHIGSAWIRTLPFSFPGAEIVMVDDLSTQRYASLFDLPEEGNYQFIEGDIFDVDLKGLFRGATAVVHLAAITNAAGSFENREQVERVNYDGTVRVADACIGEGIPLIFPSTTSVYGSAASIVDEDCGPEELKPQSPYAESKLKSEKFLLEQRQAGRLNGVVARFGTIFGVSPGMRFHTAVNKFCWQAIMGQPVTVWRTALDQKRPYLDVSDACRALDFFLRSDNLPELVNAVTANATVRDILDTIRLGVSDLNIEFVDTAIMNQLSYEVDNRRLKELGFAFRGDLQEGIRKTLVCLSHANGRNSPVPV